MHSIVRHPMRFSFSLIDGIEFNFQMSAFRKPKHVFQQRLTLSCLILAFLFVLGTAIKFQHCLAGHSLQIGLFFVVKDNSWFSAIWVFSIFQLVLGN